MQTLLWVLNQQVLGNFNEHFCFMCEECFFVWKEGRGCHIFEISNLFFNLYWSTIDRNITDRAAQVMVLNQSITPLKSIKLLEPFF